MASFGTHDYQVTNVDTQCPQNLNLWTLGVYKHFVIQEYDVMILVMEDHDKIKKISKEIALKYDLSFVAIFGSQATGATHRKSDIDIAIIRKQPISFDERLKIIGDFSDMLEREDVEIVDLTSASPTLMHAVVRDGKLLYEEKENNFLNWKIYAIKIWMETSWLRDLSRKSLLDWAAKNKINNE